MTYDVGANRKANAAETLSRPAQSGFRVSLDLPLIPLLPPDAS